MSIMHRFIAASTAFAAFTLATAPAAYTSVQDFTVPIFEGDYYLSRDSEHISHLRVHEHLVASFPEFDQNHGILRALPDEYLGHSLNLHVQGVTTSSGEPIHYTSSTKNHNKVLQIGDARRYVHGIVSYNIDYTMDNVTELMSDHAQFNWNTTGTQWQQTFGQVTARLHLTSDIAPYLIVLYNRCFTGPQDSTATDCTIANSVKPEGDSTITFTATRPLEAHETLTMNTRFASETFAAYKMPRSELLGIIGKIFLLYVLPVLLTLAFMLRKWYKYGRDPEGRGTIIPEYVPPKNLTVLGSGALLEEKLQPLAISAQIIDLAVRRYLKIYELDETKWLIRKTNYDLELIRKPDDLRADEQAVLTALFGPNPAPGQRVNTEDLKNKLYAQVTSLGNSVTQQLTVDGYFRKDPRDVKLAYITAWSTMIVLGYIFSPGLLVSGLIVLLMSKYMPARTQAGVDTRDYLLGLKLYIKMAEEDRIKYLQSPHGEGTEKVDVSDNTQLVKLYERLLPYAVLFKMEKDWAKEFAGLYDTSPDWYVGTSAWSAAYFAGSLSGLTAQASSSFTAPSSSSSGGGFSGGGGGGGGGGGW